ncbi:hypothetical protein GCM10010377_38230 [Streptomyces viridiviolaceus]|uniref:Secreted protein n=1 Tax=Streptomyces viridiviolaceus TaxID=68282 RepID=A0ABW2E483_9ACTN|nr:hypothetical protein [Streptomyces viridiviolaceus]GHB43817.1 hypothetical protein GCM10010377_38230 [Streptomyces viridiviolaceus]
MVALAGALAATLAVMVWGASSASAGGPTSVMLVSPESTETASLYYSDREYGELERLLGPVGAGSRTKPPEAGLGSARQINVTWLVHDVTPWRVDRVYAALDDRQVWIHTSTDVPGAMRGTWHRAERPDQLRALLKELGLTGKASPEGSSGIFPAPEETGGAVSGGAVTDGSAAEAGASKAPAARAAGSADGGTDWWWAVPGAAAGAVLALVLRPHVSRIPAELRRRRAEPRQELFDA